MLYFFAVLQPVYTHMYHHLSWFRFVYSLQVTTLEQRCQKLESEVQKLAQTWSEAAPAEEIKVSCQPSCKGTAWLLACSLASNNVKSDHQPKQFSLIWAHLIRECDHAIGMAA